MASVFFNFSSQVIFSSAINRSASYTHTQQISLADKQQQQTATQTEYVYTLYYLCFTFSFSTVLSCPGVIATLSSPLDT